MLYVNTELLTHLLVVQLQLQLRQPVAFIIGAVVETLAELELKMQIVKLKLTVLLKLSAEELQVRVPQPVLLINALQLPPQLHQRALVVLILIPPKSTIVLEQPGIYTNAMYIKIAAEMSVTPIAMII